jgi:hypothetical protein
MHLHHFLAVLGRIWFPLLGPGGACVGLSCAHIPGVRANIRAFRKPLIFIATFLAGNIGRGEYKSMSVMAIFRQRPVADDPLGTTFDLLRSPTVNWPDFSQLVNVGD